METLKSRPTRPEHSEHDDSTCAEVNMSLRGSKVPLTVIIASLAACVPASPAECSAIASLPVAEVCHERLIGPVCTSIFSSR